MFNPSKLLQPSQMFVGGANLLKDKTVTYPLILDSIVVSIPACHAGGRGSIPRREDIFFKCLSTFKWPWHFSK